MAAAEETVANTGGVDLPSAGGDQSADTDFNLSSQPLVIDCPADPVLGQSISTSTAAEGQEPTPTSSPDEQSQPEVTIQDQSDLSSQDCASGVDAAVVQPLAQSSTVVMHTQATIGHQQSVLSGSTIAQTLQDLVSPGSTVYGSVSSIAPQQQTVICPTGGQASINAEGSNMTSLIGTDSSLQQQQQQTVQFLAPQLQQPLTMFSTIDTRQIQQHVIQPQQRQSGAPVVIGSVANSPVSQQPQSAICQLAAQPSTPQGMMTGQQAVSVTGFQSLVGQGTAVYGGGTHMMCATPESAAQSHMDIAMACQQQYTIQAAAATPNFQQSLMTAMPQTVQVIQTGPQVVQQQCLQQQYMFQTNQVQTLQSTSAGVTVAASTRPPAKSPGALSIAPQTSVQGITSKPLAAKGTVAASSSQSTSNLSVLRPVQAQPQQQQQQATQQNTSLVIGQLGVMPNTQVVQQNILPQQSRAISLCSVNQQPLSLGQVNQSINLGQIGQPINLGQVGQQLQFGQPLNLGPINHSLNFGPVNQALTLGQVNQALNLGQMNQTLNLGPMNQVIGTGQTQIRLAMPNLSFNTAQLVGGGQTVLNFQNVPVMQQQLLTSQPTATILGSQPLYIRTAEPFMQQQQQQQSTIAVANVQAVAPVRNIVMAQQVQPAVSSSAQSQPLRRLQVQPNNSSIAPATSGTKLLAIAQPQSSNSTSSKTGQVKPKPVSQSAALTVVAKSIAPATASSSTTPRPAKSTSVSTPVAVKSQPVSVLVSASSSPTVTTACSSVAANTPVSVQTVAATSTAVADATQAKVVISTSVPKSPVTMSPAQKTDSVKNGADETVSTAVTAKSAVKTEDDKTWVKVEDEKLMKTAVDNVVKTPSKSKKPKILTHVIEGFIIQEASEPFPVNGSSLINQLWSPKVPVMSDDGYSSPKSEKDAEDDEETDTEKDTDVTSPKKPKMEDKEVEPVSEAMPIVIAPETTVSHEPKLICEFCGKHDVIANFARSRRFCSVTCSKRFSAYSMRKAPDGSVTGRPANLNSKPRRSTGSANRTQPTVNQTVAVESRKTETAITPTAAPIRAADPRIVSIKASAGATGSSSESSEDLETSGGTATPSHGGLGDSSSSSQLSPPALERVERIVEKETQSSTNEEGVIIPSKPVQYWGVQEVYDFIRTLPGCGMYADDFRQQEIDGSALMLLKEDHLMTTMNVKLGPALKICSKISSLKD